MNVQGSLSRARICIHASLSSSRAFQEGEQDTLRQSEPPKLKEVVWTDLQLERLPSADATRDGTRLGEASHNGAAKIWG